MGEVCEIQLTDDTSIGEVSRLLEVLQEGGYVTQERWSEGVIAVRKRENETLTGSEE